MAIKEIFSTPIPALVHVVTINLIRFGVVLRSLLSIVNRVAAAILFGAYITSTFCSCMMLYTPVGISRLVAINWSVHRECTVI